MAGDCRLSPVAPPAAKSQEVFLSERAGTWERRHRYLDELMPVVEVIPVVERGCSLAGVLVSEAIGPHAPGRLNEIPEHADGLRSEGFSEPVANAPLFEGQRRVS